MTNSSGLSPKSPNQYVGPNVYLATVVTRNRAPTGADYRQPETGKLYPLDTYWIVGKDPTTGTRGDLWYLASIISNVATWKMLSSGSSGPTIGFVIPNGTSPVFPTGAGLVTLTSTGGTIIITGSTNTINFETGGTVATRYTENTGTAVPSAGNLNVLGSGSTTTIGSGSTVSVQLQGLTNHNVLVGAGTTTITKVAPSATSGIPFISQGAAADPLFGTAVVAGGGTGNTSFTAFSPIVGGTTTTGPLQSASTGQSTSGFVFTSTGAASLPTFQPIYTQGTFTPTLQFGGASTGITYLNRTGLYTVIGNMVFFEAEFTLSSKGSSTGIAQVINLPFVANFGTSAFLSITQFTLPNTTTQIWGQINTGATILLCIYADAATGAAVQMDDTNFMNNTAILFQGFYFLS